MIKHHRYGTGYLITEAHVPDTKLDIEKPVPGSWNKVLELPIQDAIPHSLGPTLEVSLEFLKDITPPIFIVGIPAAGTPSALEGQLRHPRSFVQFTTAIKAAVAKGFPLRSCKIYMAAPKPDDVRDLVNTVHDIIVAKVSAGEKPTSTDFQRVKTLVSGFSPSIAAMVEFEFKPYQRSGKITSYPEFLPHNSGVAVIGLARKDPTRPIDAKDIALLDTTGKNLITKRKDITEAFLHAYYHSLWSIFHNLTFNTGKGNISIVRKLEDAINDPSSRRAYAKAKNLEEPKTEPPPENTSRETGENPVLYPRNKVPIPREPHTPYVKVSASVRDTGSEVGSFIISSNPADRQWQNSQGSYITPDALPAQEGSWTPADRVQPLVDTPRYRAYFGIYYDHPLLRPSSSKQPYWYGNRNQFIAAAEQYAKMTGDHPPLFVRIVDKSRWTTVTRRELGRDQSTVGSESRAEIDHLISAFSNAVRKGKTLWPIVYKEKLGDSVVLDNNKRMPDNPTKMKKYPEGTTEKQWFAYLKWIRGEGEKVLGLKFGAKRAAFVSGEKFKYLRHSGHINAINAIKRNVALTGERDEKGEPIEPFALYFIEFILAHKTVVRDYFTYMVPLNVIRSSEDLPPRRRIGKLTKDEYLKHMKDDFIGRGISLVDWNYVSADMRRTGLPYSFLVRPAYMAPQYQKQLNSVFSKVKTPNIQRTDFEYIIDGIHWDAYEMVVAMPARVAQKEFGFIEANSYSRMLANDPNILNRIKRAVGGKNSTLKSLGLHPMKTNVEFVGNPYAKVNPGDMDPNFGVKATEIDPKYWKSKIGERWEPRVVASLNELGQVVDVFVKGYTRANSAQDRGKYWDQFMQKTQAVEARLESEKNGAIADMIQETQGDELKNDFGPDLGRSVQSYVQYVDQVISAGSDTEITVRVPTIVNKLGLTTYTAPIGSVAGRTVNFSVKAPSEAIARSVIALKLLRRSRRNKQLGRILAQRGAGGSLLLPEFNAMTLAQWAETGFIVLENNDPRGLRFHLKARPLSYLQMKRASRLGDFRTITMLRTD